MSDTRVVDRPAAHGAVATRLRRADRTGTLRFGTFSLLCFLFFSIPWQGAFDFPVVGNVSRFLSFALIGAGGLTLALEGRRRPLLDLHVLMAVLAVWAFASSFWSIAPDRSAAAAVDLAQLVLVMVLAWEFAPSRRQVEVLMGSLLVGSLVAAASVVRDYVEYRDLAPVERYTAGNLHPNDLAFILGLAVVLAWYLSCTVRNPLVAMAARLFVPMAIFTVVLTASRAGLAVIPIALLIVPWTFSRTPVPIRLGLVGLSVALVVVVPGLLPTAQLERLSTTGTAVESGDLGGRAQLWDAAMDMFDEHILTGVGVGASRVEMAEATGHLEGAHNTFLSVAAELGIVGLALFLLVLLAIGRRGLQAGPMVHRLTAVLAAVLLVGLQVRHWEYRLGLWAVLAIVINLSSLPTSDDGAATTDGGPSPAPS